MQEKQFVKSSRAIKIVQLCVLSLIGITFFLILIFNPDVGKEIYANKTLFVLCAITWILMLVSLGFTLFDFFKMRSFAEESHALNKVAYLDHLTGIPNRHGLDAVFQTYDSPESMATVGCFMVTIENLKESNKTQGHQTGDLMIQHFCSIFENIGDKFGVVGRNGGNDFVLVVNHCTDEIMQDFIDTLNAEIENHNKEYSDAALNLKYSYVLNTDEHANAFTQLMTATYNKLHG